MEKLVALLQDIDWPTTITLVTTVVLVILTGVYVRMTGRLVQAQAEPCVVVFARHDESRSSLLQIVIKNVGQYLARDITFTLSKPLPQRAFGLDEQSAKQAEDMTTGPLITGIPALALGEDRKMAWGQYAGLKKSLGTSSVTVTAHFKCGSRRVEPVESVLEIESFEMTDVVDLDGARQYAKQLKRIADKV